MTLRALKFPELEEFEGLSVDPLLPPGIRKSVKRKTAWSAAGKVITQVNATAIATGGSLTVSEAKMQANFEREFGEAGEFTIQFTVKPPVDPKQVAGVNIYSGFYQAIAEVTWSVEGNTNRRLLSIAQGAVISGVGQAVKVRCFDVTPSITKGLNPPSTPGLPYQVSMLCAPGSRPSSSSPPVLAIGMPVIIAPGATVAFPLPADAGITSAQVLAYDTSTPGTAVNASVQQQAGVAAAVLADYDAIQHSDEFVPLVAGTCQLAITNNAGADSILVTVLWGIDG